jgi:hypothetical protein
MKWDWEISHFLLGACRRYWDAVGGAEGTGKESSGKRKAISEKSGCAVFYSEICFAKKEILF